MNFERAALDQRLAAFPPSGPGTALHLAPTLCVPLSPLGGPVYLGSQRDDLTGHALGGN